MAGKVLNLAAFDLETRALGPGVRSAVWVQGCPFACRGCIAPEWIPIRAADQVPCDDLAQVILSSSEVSGLTISGGEPMLQAPALLELVRLVRRQRNVDVICFTGYTLAQLQAEPPSLAVPEFLQEIDLLVDGPYQMELNDDRGLRGSSNQQFHYLSGALREVDFASYPRKVELKINAGHILFTGIPTRRGLALMDQALQSVRSRSTGLTFTSFDPKI